MKQVFLSTTTEFKEIDALESGTWINLVNPSQSESIEIANAFGIDITDLRAPLDAEEMSRVTIEDEYTLIIVDVPITEERNNQTYYVTIPLGIIITEEAIFFLSLGKIPLPARCQNSQVWDCQNPPQRPDRSDRIGPGWPYPAFHP